MKHKLILIVAALLSSLLGHAQAMNTEPQMADSFRSEGKIYVVISVLAIVFTCLISYLIYIDVKLKKLENRDKGL
jgi:uncharacterized membrane protein YidH (DUF202 family)